MKLADLKWAYVLSCAVLIFVVWIPTVVSLVPFPEGEKFSEMWLLGENHVIESYPFDVAEGELHRVYLGVGNRLGDSSYYIIYAKFRNQAEPLPDRAAGLPSSLEPVFEYRVFLGDNETWEKEVTFSVGEVSFREGTCRVSRILIDGNSVDVDKVAVRDEADGGFYYELFFELWFYNTSVSSFEFHNRFVGYWLKMSA